jgi:hypothetical protein
MDFVYDVEHRPELNGSPVQHQADRPLVLTNGLMEQDQGL